MVIFKQKTPTIDAEEWQPETPGNVPLMTEQFLQMIGQDPEDVDPTCNRTWAEHGLWQEQQPVCPGDYQVGGSEFWPRQQFLARWEPV